MYKQRNHGNNSHMVNNFRLIRATPPGECLLKVVLSNVSHWRRQVQKCRVE